MSKAVETDEKGIPLKSAYPEKPSVAVFYGGMTAIFTIIGYLIARFGCYRGTTAAPVDAKIAIVAEYDLAWLYLGLFLIKLLQLPIGINLGKARKESKIGLPNQQVYKVCGAAGSNLGYVLMENDGALGKFNRAQRALMNYHENFPTVALQYVVASFVFPKEAFACILVWAVATCISADGYANGVDGRMGGVVPRILSMNTLSGMLLFVAVKILM
mmetsp:Transcript_26582/g.32202  ORF Transcript_26582/g.32202 Transcript_26582/m.32202 type:complete len:215 (-) Transcript_26582:209-853(-)|eukprot:CAMPEP_0172504682 /NCGR_PEP_ID=MMETSP1066-20121228/180483_1 /TAXON_ID=671091 /ORGANISM="Coscinodiscus wailesii, Strain CCMP2513" /LENGTH=214 /DNA_ID=CAMNT_0013280957 /DNA_START=88 /DNA_END=732 /DNA_ORIENTATION=-